MDDPPEELPEELKRLVRINEARTNEGAAYAYARAGFRLFPVYEVRPDGSCACGKPDCDDVGKHPYYRKDVIEHGCEDATTDLATIQGWWRRWPTASIGWATDGYRVLDPDAKEPGKPDGVDAWEAMRERYQLPPTLIARSGNGGKHVVYSVPEGVTVSNSGKALPDGIHVRGQGQYIVVSPSVHKSGNRYEWVDIHPIAPLPQVLVDLLTPKPSPPKPPALERKPITQRGVITTGSPIYDGNRNEELTRVAGAFAGKCGLDEEGVIQALLAANENRCRPPLPESEVIKIARSVSKTERCRGRPAPVPDRDGPSQPCAREHLSPVGDDHPAEPPAPALSRGCSIATHKRVYLNDAGQSVCATCWTPRPGTPIYEVPS